ncbi:MAG: dihydroorotate dehydrogenase electron transfer subunit [Bacteroidota bacterium]|nr:dihydroorotate dehydrogenase electron transfer subunit [Bacteroidota bacterium]
MKKRVEDLKIINKQILDNDYIFLEVQSKNTFEKIIPGQFVNIYVEDSSTTFLRRPFSIHNVDYKKNSIQMLIKIIGNGTSTLSKKEKGNNLNMIYPLGNGFSLAKEKKVLLIGGGFGIAPLYFLAKELKKNNTKPVLLFGAKTKNDFVFLDKYNELFDLHLTTEDASIGEKGFVTNHSILKNKEYTFDKIYSCGPEPMMKAVAKYSKINNIDCEVSLDNLMACGIGVCLCCVTETTNGNKTVCQEGPIFNTKELKW